MEKQMVFSSTTAKARFFIMQCVAREEREYERKELVDYVNKMAGSDESMTAGVIAGAVKMLTCSGELITVKRGVFKRGVRKTNATAFEKIHSVCARFATEFEKACTINVLSLTEEERVLYPEIVETLELGRANIYDFMDQLEELLKRIRTANVEKSLVSEPVAVVAMPDTGVVEVDALGSENASCEVNDESTLKNDKRKEGGKKA